MGTDNLFKKGKAARSLVRKKATREKRDRILIVCEGEKTEPEYFKGFHLTNVDVQGTGLNTIFLVQKAIQLKKDAKRAKEEYDQVWCVFDRDYFPAQNFNNAFTLAKQHNIKIAYSNEAFELWFLLHFNYCDAALSRQNYSNNLDRLLGFKYDKSDPDLFDILIDKQEVAIRNAITLLTKYPNLNPEKDNPSTTVHQLVKELNKWIHKA